MEDLSSSVPAYGILHIVNGFLPSGAYLLAASCRAAMYSMLECVVLGSHGFLLLRPIVAGA
jgi:hypothetical protein